MRLPSLPVFALLLASSCSALVKIDDDKYTGGAGIGDGDPGDGEGAGDGDGDVGGSDGDGDDDTGGSSNGGTGGSIDGDGDGDEPSGGLGGVGDGGTGGGPTGGGGVIGTPIEIREPVHYYPLDGNTDDLGTGEARSATVTDNVTWFPTSGLRGGALEIPVSEEEYLSLSPQVANTSPFTISWWFIQSSDGFISLSNRFSEAQPTNSWDMIADPESPRVKIGDTEFHLGIKFPSSSQGQWVHIAFGYQEMFSGTNDRLKVWVNGENVVDETIVLNASALAPNVEIRFGAGGSFTNAFFGFVDEVRVYEDLLSDQEVEALFLFDAP